jgi:hypothetical protein
MPLIAGLYLSTLPVLIPFTDGWSAPAFEIQSPADGEQERRIHIGF